MHPIDIIQEAKAPKKTTVQEFCSKMRVLTRERYYQALRHCGALPQDTASTTSAPSLTPTHFSDSTSTSSWSTPSSLPCYKIYRNWHAEDLQRQEKCLSMVSEDPSGSKEKPSTFLLSYPAEKYKIKTRVPDFSPIVNPYFNLLGLFFCATATTTAPPAVIPTSPPTAPSTPVSGDDEGSKKSLQEKPTTPPRLTEFSAPVETSPYGKERYQVPFGDLEQRLFPEYRLFFADFYQIKEDWYVQLVVVPSWNRKLEEQCRVQGLVELDAERNPFFFRRPVDNGSVASGLRHGDCRYPNSSAGFRKPIVRRPYYPPSSSRPYHFSATNSSSTTAAETKYEYRVYTHPEGHAKVWTELLVGCDVFPTSEIGERVDCLLHENVRKTANKISIQQERHQLATILEGVALDISQIAGRLRGRTDGVITKEHEEGDETEEERGEMKKVLELTYRLSRDRTRLGVLQSSATARRSRVALHAREGWSRL
ncbi:hypothetical protein BG015_005899 [Linnemannia schmuckeri]|uniref:Phytanoyl-CoA hydroxylase-interacting protein-like C-terminal domain-containing protein n=1 Tax=Linnemannia schmuckeri TaxID=64567 RepID=A0A9P5S0C8_9FUNG|nr:hypothetical protein BG015_005899 [Linnemannia schmuckeri]